MTEIDYTVDMPAKSAPEWDVYLRELGDYATKVKGYPDNHTSDVFLRFWSGTPGFKSSSITAMFPSVAVSRVTPSAKS